MEVVVVGHVHEVFRQCVVVVVLITGGMSGTKVDVRYVGRMKGM